jgi:hypothetical protein
MASSYKPVPSRFIGGYPFHGNLPCFTAPTCARCGGLMVVAYSVPKLGPHPEIRSFKCPACGEVETHIIEGVEDILAYRGPERRKRMPA